MEEIKSKIESLLKRRIKGEQEDIDNYMEDAANDYEQFFLWDSEDMYKSILMKKFYKSLEGYLNSNDIASFKNKLEEIIEMNISDLLDAPVRRKSTSELMNLAYACEMEVKQRTIRICKGIIHEYLRS